MPFTDTCSCLCALLSVAFVLLSLVVFLFLSRSALRVIARCAHLRKRARPKSARVCGSVQKKCSSLRKSASEPTSELMGWRNTARTRARASDANGQGTRSRQRRGDRQAARSLAFTRSVSRWKPAVLRG